MGVTDCAGWVGCEEVKRKKRWVVDYGEWGWVGRGELGRKTNGKISGGGMVTIVGFLLFRWVA